MTDKLRQGSGFPRHCWLCGKHLQWAPGKGKGLVYYNLVQTPDGYTHRVHGDCTNAALGDGVRLYKSPGS